MKESQEFVLLTPLDNDHNRETRACMRIPFPCHDRLDDLLKLDSISLHINGKELCFSLFSFLLQNLKPVGFRFSISEVPCGLLLPSFNILQSIFLLLEDVGLNSKREHLKQSKNFLDSPLS